MELSAVREPQPRHGRRLWDKILVAFHHACDVDDYEIAAAMLRALETMLVRVPTDTDSNRRRTISGPSRHDPAAGIGRTAAG